MEHFPPSLLLPALIFALSMLSAATGIIGYFLKDIKSEQRKRDNHQDKAIQSVKDDLAEFKAQLPHIYALRDDFVREISSLNLKMDRVARDLSGLVRAIENLAGGKNDER